MKPFNRTVKIIFCSTLFQVYWFVLVWSAGKTVSMALALLCVFLSLLQLVLLARPLLPSLKYLAIGVLAGVVMDSVLTYVGVHNPARVLLPTPIAPVWLIGLWVAFVVYTRTGLDGLRGRFLLPAAAGFVGGPLAWLGGARMGACEVSHPLFGYGVMAVCWAILCVALFQLSDVLQVRHE